MKVMLIDQRDISYVFDSGSVTINNKPKGKGRLITPISEIALLKEIRFVLGLNSSSGYSTSPIKGCFVSED